MRTVDSRAHDVKRPGLGAALARSPGQIYMDLERRVSLQWVLRSRAVWKRVMARDQSAATERSRKSERRGGRPSTSRAISIDATIRTVALELFLEQGFDAVTMEMIAQRAQVSKPTLYTRHAGKVDLLRAVIRDEVERWLAIAQDLDRQLPADLGDRLRAHARNIIASQDWSDFRRLNRLITGVAATHPEILSSPYEAGLEPVVRLLADDLRTASAAVGLKDADWEFLAEMFFHAIFSWSNSASMLRKVDADEALAFSDKVVGLVLLAAEQSRRRTA